MTGAVGAGYNEYVEASADTGKAPNVRTHILITVTNDAACLMNFMCTILPQNGGVGYSVFGAAETISAPANSAY